MIPIDKDKPILGAIGEAIGEAKSRGASPSHVHLSREDSSRLLDEAHAKEWELSSESPEGPLPFDFMGTAYGVPIYRGPGESRVELGRN